MSLTSKQRAYLNSQAHSLKPIIQIGKNGLNDQIKTSVRQALDARELIKVTLLQNTDENIHEVAEILEDEIGVDTGSFGLRYYNSIFREAKDSLHDIDLYLDVKKELKATKYKNLRHDEFEDTNFFKELSKQYPHLSFAISFGETYNNQIYQYVVTKDTQTKALIDQAIEQLKSQKKRVGIDAITELLPEDKANQFYWLDIFIGYDIPNTLIAGISCSFVLKTIN